MTTPWLRWRFAACALLLLCLSIAPALAQSIEMDAPEPEVTEEAVTPVLISLGVSSGFPGFNRFSVNAAAQYRFIGLSIKAAPTPAGLYFGAGVRGYVPLGGFVPLYVGLGGGVYGESSELHLVLGGHVPLAENFRLDFEVGAARASLLDTVSYLPWVSLGVSYSFPVEPGGVGRGPGGFGGGSGGVGSCTSEPSEAALVSAFERTLRSFISSARATYGGSYTNLSYDYDIIDVTMTEDSGSVTIRYSGSVHSVIGGGVESARGTASASFSWNGCRWLRTSLDY